MQDLQGLEVEFDDEPIFVGMIGEPMKVPVKCEDDPGEREEPCFSSGSVGDVYVYLFACLCGMLFFFHMLSP